MKRHDDLHFDGIHLRKPLEKDIKDRFVCGRTDDFVYHLGMEQEKDTSFTIEDAIKWYEDLAANPHSWVIEYADKCIGMVELKLEEIKPTSYSIAIFDDECLDKGIGTKITKNIVEYAFNHYQVDSIYLNVLDYNKRAIACYQKVGFKLKEVIENTRCINNQWVNDFVMEIHNQAK